MEKAKIITISMKPSQHLKLVELAKNQKSTLSNFITKNLLNDEQ